MKVSSLVALVVVALCARPAFATSPPRKAKEPPKPSLALLPLEGILPEKELRSVEDDLRKALPAQNYVVQKRDRTRQTLVDMRSLGLACDTGVVDCLVQVGGLAGVNVMLRGGLTSIDATTDQLELLGVDVNALKERARVKVRVPRGDVVGRAKAIDSALTGVLRPEAWRGALRISSKQQVASIYVDGVYRGETPYSQAIELTPGEHALWVGKAPLRPFQQRVVVPYDDEVVVEVVLEPGMYEPPPRYASTPTTAPEAKAPTPATPARKAPLRVVVYDVDALGIEPRVARVLGQLLVEEIRKRERVSVLDSGELRALVGEAAAAQRDFRGCSASECFAEVAEALGAEVVISSTLVQQADGVKFGLRRVDTLSSTEPVSFIEQAPLGDTNALLPFVGKSIAAVFPELPLRKGQKAGVDAKAELRLNPPPLPPVYATTAYAGAGIAGVVGVGSLIGSAVVAQVYRDGARTAGEEPKPDEKIRVESDVLMGQRNAVGVLLPVGIVALGSATLAGVAGAALGNFTDWDGYRTRDVE